MRTKSHLVRDLTYYKYSEGICKAFKRLRKEGYRCLMNVGRPNGKLIDITKPYVYYLTKSAYLSSSEAKIYYNGDLNLIEGIFASEGLEIGFVSTQAIGKYFALISDTPGYRIKDIGKTILQARIDEYGII